MSDPGALRLLQPYQAHNGTFLCSEPVGGSSPKLSGLTILTFFLFQFWKDEIASKATHFGWVVISLSI